MFALSGLAGVARKTQSVIKGEVVKLIREGLRAASGNMEVQMDYVTFHESIVSKYKIDLIGWPLAPERFKNPTHLGTPELRIIHTALTSNPRTMFWIPLSDQEVTARADIRTAFKERGEPIPLYIPTVIPSRLQSPDTLTSTNTPGATSTSLPPPSTPLTPAVQSTSPTSATPSALHRPTTPAPSNPTTNQATRPNSPSNDFGHDFTGDDADWNNTGDPDVVRPLSPSPSLLPHSSSHRVSSQVAPPAAYGPTATSTIVGPITKPKTLVKLKLTGTVTNAVVSATSATEQAVPAPPKKKSKAKKASTSALSESQAEEVPPGLSPDVAPEPAIAPSTSKKSKRKAAPTPEPVEGKKQPGRKRVRTNRETEGKENDVSVLAAIAADPGHVDPPKKRRRVAE